MLALTSQEIARYRSQLANSQEALAALDMIEDCEGDLEDAAISLAIQVGQTPDRSDWLGGLAKRCRSAICQAECQEKLLEGQLAEGLELLIQARICPPILATPVVLYVIQQGVAQFCEPLNFPIKMDS